MQPLVVIAPPPPLKPSSRACVASGSIGGSAPFHSAYPEPAGEIWTPSNTDGLNGANPASYNNDSGNGPVIPFAVYRSRGWRLQARVVGNVTTATSSGQANGPAGHFIVNAWVSAVWAVALADGAHSFSGPWVDILPGDSLATVSISVQTTRYAPTNSSNDNITYQGGCNIEFQWVNP